MWLPFCPLAHCSTGYSLWSALCSSRLLLITDYRQDLRGNVSKVLSTEIHQVILKCNSDLTIATMTQKPTTFLTRYDAFSSVPSRICRRISKMILSSLRVFSISVFRDFYFIVSDGFIVSTLAPLVCLVSQMLRVLLQFPTWGLIINKNLKVEK